MNYLPQNTMLGKLVLVEIYEYYDRPVLFACRNSIDTLYLTVLIEESQNSDTWLFCGLSQTRFQAVRSGGIDLHDAFANPEDGAVIKIQIPTNNSELTEIQIIPTEEIPEKYLPLAGECLNLETHTLPDFELDVQQKAIRTRRDVIRFLLQFGNQLRRDGIMRQRSPAPRWRWRGERQNARSNSLPE
jgi:hypothetical protein